MLRHPTSIALTAELLTRSWLDL